MGMGGYTIMTGATDKYITSGQIVSINNGVWNDAMPYNGGTMDNDFVILKLASSLTFNENVQAACLPDSSFAPAGQMCFTSGWGTLQSGGSSPSDLQWVDVPIVTNAVCDASYNGMITNSMICAGYPEGGKDACQGDSGGPLVCEVDGKAVLTGVTSWGYGCASPNYYGVYSRVTAALSWIQSNLGSNGMGAPPPPAGPCVKKLIPGGEIITVMTS